jgi:hypothetical protein
MAILRSFIFRPESNLPRPDSPPVVPHPDDVFVRDGAILKNVSQSTIWGGIFAIAAFHIPNNAIWKPVIRLAKGHDLGSPDWRSPHVPAKTQNHVASRLRGRNASLLVTRKFPPLHQAPPAPGNTLHRHRHHRKRRRGSVGVWPVSNITYGRTIGYPANIGSDPSCGISAIVDCSCADHSPQLKSEQAQMQILHAVSNLSRTDPNALKGRQRCIGILIEVPGHGALGSLEPGDFRVVG